MSLRPRISVVAIFTLCVAVAVGADVTGKWSGEMTLTVPRVQTRSITMDLKVQGSSVSGTFGAGADQVQILDGKTDQDNVTFGIPTGADDMPRFEFKGKVDADTFKFTISGVDPGGKLRTLGDGTAKRVH